MVSIIVPVYNIEKYLSVCVDSLVKQTYPDLEIILVDDGSADGSAELCDALAEGDRRIRVIHKENGGLSDARNAGLAQATGDWVLFVDGDDFLVPDAVERLMVLAEEDVDFIQFHYWETDGTTPPPENETSSEPIVCSDNEQMWRWLYEKGGVAASSCTKLWARRLFQDVQFRKGILHEDEELLNRMLPNCRKVIYTDFVLYGYVMRCGSIIHGNFRPKSMIVFSIMEERIAVLETCGLQDLVTETKSRMFQSAVIFYCLARREKCKTEEAVLKNYIKILAKEKLELSGQYKLLHKLSRVIPGAVQLYYFIRRACGKS